MEVRGGEPTWWKRRDFDGNCAEKISTTTQQTFAAYAQSQTHTSKHLIVTLAMLVLFSRHFSQFILTMFWQLNSTMQQQQKQTLSNLTMPPPRHISRQIHPVSTDKMANGKINANKALSPQLDNIQNECCSAVSRSISTSQRIQLWKKLQL